MAHVIVLTGPSGCGKSTTDLNLRLRLTGTLESGEWQITDQDAIFAGRILFQKGDKVLRFPGGDATGYQWASLYECCELAPTVVFDKYHVPPHVYTELVRRGHKVTVVHFCTPIELCEKRLASTGHPNPTRATNAALRPGDEDYLEKRDATLERLGITVRYFSGDLAERIALVEQLMDVEPVYDYMMYDVRGDVETLVERFLKGGDKPRAMDATCRDRGARAERSARIQPKGDEDGAR